MARVDSRVQVRGALFALDAGAAGAFLKRAN